MGWKVVVDENRCEANAVCVGLAPEVFELPDDSDVAACWSTSPTTRCAPRSRPR